MSLADNKRIAALFLEKAFTNQTEAALALLSADAVWRVMGDPAQLPVAGVKDRAQIARLLRGVARAVPAGMRFELHGITAEGERVAVEAESWATWVNGKAFHNRYHFLFRVQGGEVIEIREYMDTLHVFQTTQA